MVQTTIQVPYVNDSFFERSNPCKCKITKVDVGVNEWKKPDYIVTVVNEHAEAKLSVYGANLRELQNNAGMDTDDWVGATVRMSQTVVDGKKKRFISVLATD